MLTLSADKGFAPLFSGHEPDMLLLHQSAYCKTLPHLSLFFPILFTGKTMFNVKSPVQVSHLLLPITKRLHFFYANQAIWNTLLMLMLILIKRFFFFKKICFSTKLNRDTEELNPIFSICNQNVKPFTTCPFFYMHH